MSAPISAARVIAGLAISAASLWFLNGRTSRSELWDLKSDSFERNFEHNFAMVGHEIWSGTGLEPQVAGWVKFKHYGPFGLFKTFREWSNTVGGFVDDVVKSPFTAFAVGGLYFAGLKPHKWVVGAYNLVKDTNVFQTLGAKIWNSRTFFNGSWTKKVIQKLFTAPGLALASFAGLAALQFMKVFNREEQHDLFYPK